MGAARSFPVSAPVAGHTYFDLVLQDLGAGPDASTISPLRGVSDDEYAILKKLKSQLTGHVASNLVKQDCYEAKQEIRHLEISVPRNLTDIGTAVGWPGTVVDALDERIDFISWSTDDGQLNGLDEVFTDNDLQAESNAAHVDALITGVSFVSVGTDDDPFYGGRRQLVSVESSSHATVIWDYRKRRSVAGLSQTLDERANILAETLYLEDSTLIFARDVGSGALELVDVIDHEYGRCFMTRIVNRARPYRTDGRSEITRPVRYYTAAAVRTMLGMEVNREFYTAPQRFMLNARPEDFGVTEDMTPEQKFRRGLSIAMGMVNIVPPRTDNTEGDPPAIVEMRPAPPTPYIEQVKAYSIQMAAETGLPATVFGFVTDNPTSGDAIVKSEFRLTRKASRRIGTFGQGWREVGLLALLARDGAVDPAFARRLKCQFANPMLPTPAATADEIQKMVAANVLVPDSSVTYDLYGRLDKQQQKRLEQDKLAYEAKVLRQALQQAEMAAAQNPQGQGAPNGQQRPAPETGAR